ncbi:MAG: heterodisulfide reductase-related iron-sulfur binding cluster [Bacteroidales bacterium]
MTGKGLKNAAVSCITSFGGYNDVTEIWKEFPDEEAKARKILKKATGRTFEIPQNIAHSCDIIYKFRNDIAKLAKYKLINKQTSQPLKVVDHIGCHYAKIFPNKAIGGAERTTVLSALVEAWGGLSVDYPERRHCCGFGFRHYLIKNNRSYSITNSKKKFESMKPYQPDFIITNCLGCNMFLDRWQYTLAQINGKTYSGDNNGIPVLSYEKLAGLVLGYNPWDIGLQMHQIDVEPLIDKIGIVYNETEKHHGSKGQKIGEPEFTGSIYI